MVRLPFFALVLATLAWTAGWCLAGWGLSLLGVLHRTGLAVAGLAVAYVTLLAWQRGWRESGGIIRWHRFYRHSAAGIFAVLFGLIAVSAVLHAPNNFDALTYRFPRVAHWIDADGWHWMETSNQRLNYSGTVAEWLHAPAWALAHSVRWPVVVNLIAFALMPGLCFVLFRGCGVRPKIAREWMWLAPTGYGFFLQAASAGNDLLGAYFFLAASALALRARDHEVAAPWSVIAMALCTGVKASNIFLAVPWLALFPREAWRKRGLPAVVVVASVISIAPTLFLNIAHTGHPSGDPSNEHALRPNSAPIAVAGNAVLLAWQNLVPPIWPIAGATNRWTEAHLNAPVAWVKEGLPRFTLRVTELAQEEWSGLGLPLLVLLVYCLIRGRPAGDSSRLAPWIAAHLAAVLAVFALLGSESVARLLLPYYPLLLAAVLVGNLRSPRGRGWTVLVGINGAIAVVVLVLNPARPMWPWRSILTAETASHPLAARATRVYSIYGQRADYLAPLRLSIPNHETKIGFLAGLDDSEWSLRRVPGSRQIITAAQLEPLLAPTTGVNYLAVRTDALPRSLHEELRSAAVAKRIHLVSTHEVETKASQPPEVWTVWRVRHASEGVVPPGSEFSRKPSG